MGHRGAREEKPEASQGTSAERGEDGAEGWPTYAEWAEDGANPASGTGQEEGQQLAEPEHGPVSEEGRARTGHPEGLR